MTEKDEKTLAEFQEGLEQMVKTEVSHRIGDKYFSFEGRPSDYFKRHCREEVIYLLRRAMAEIR